MARGRDYLKVIRANGEMFDCRSSLSLTPFLRLLQVIGQREELDSQGWVVVREAIGMAEAGRTFVLRIGDRMEWR